MQNAEEFRTKLFDKRSVLALVLLAPALFWWAALAISLAALTGIAEYLGSNIMQVIILVICPFSAAILSLGTSNGARLRWMIAFAGIGLTALAVLASVRSS